MTGIERIKKERAEQIHKHGFSLEKDAEFYKNGELLQAAEYCREQALVKMGQKKECSLSWPAGWGEYFDRKIQQKNPIDQLTVCGAFFLAEYDRTGNEKYETEAIIIGREIDRLL